MATRWNFTSNEIQRRSDCGLCRRSAYTKEGILAKFQLAVPYGSQESGGRRLLWSTVYRFSERFSNSHLDFLKYASLYLGVQIKLVFIKDNCRIQRNFRHNELEKNMAQIGPAWLLVRSRTARPVSTLTREHIQLLIADRADILPISRTRRD